MSRALTVPQLLKAYDRWHVDAVEVKRGGVLARDHHRPGAYGDMHGQLVHHTGPYSTVAGMVALLWDGRPDLEGPIATDGIAPDGKVYVVSGGRASHAGKGGANVHAALLADRTPPPPGPDAVDGNAVLYGDELLNAGDGVDDYPNRQVEATVRVNAARAEAHGWTGSSTIRHAGWTTRKIDTRGRSAAGDVLTQSFLQNEVDRALRLGPDDYTYPEAPDMDVPDLTAALKGNAALRAAMQDAVLDAPITMPADLQRELGYGSGTYAARDLIRGADVQARRAIARADELEVILRTIARGLNITLPK